MCPPGDRLDRLLAVDSFQLGDEEHDSYYLI